MIILFMKYIMQKIRHKSAFTNSFFYWQKLTKSALNLANGQMITSVEMLERNDLSMS